MVVQNIMITLTNSSIQAMPGETYELGVTLTNNSGEVERFELAVSELDPSWYQFDWPDMLLYPDPPGNEGTVYLKLNIPADARSGTYAPVIEARGNQSATVTQPFYLTVNKVENLTPELILNPETRQTNARSARFQMAIRNPLNRPMTLQLKVRQSRPDAQIRLVPPVVEVLPYGEVQGFLDIRPQRRNWFRPPQRYDFSVGADNLPQETSGALVQTCLLPWLLKLLTTPFLLAAAIIFPILLSALIVFLLLQPSSRTANNRTPTAGLQPAECVAPNTTLLPTLQTRGNTTDVIVTDLDGSRPRKIVDEPAERLPGLFSSLISVSPDGSSLAYVTARNEALDDAVIYTVNINLGSQSKQRITNVPNGLWTSRPVWSKDNSNLSYVVRNNTQLQLWTVKVNDNDKNARAVATPSQLTANLYYGDPGVGPLCWSTDNTRLVIRPKSSFKQTEIVVATGDIRPDINQPPSTKLQIQKLNSAEPPLAPIGEGVCYVPTYSQNDPNWYMQPMRSADDKNGTDKISESGCALTAAAMMLNYYKISTDPNELNATCLRTEAVLFDWALTAKKCSRDVVAGGIRQDFSWNSLNSTLKTQPAVVGLLGGQTGIHYVVVVGGTEGIASTYRVNDPWDGTNNKSLAYFLQRGYQLRWIINYNSPNAPTCPDRSEFVPKFLPGFKLFSPNDGGLYSQPVPINFQADPGVTANGALYITNEDQSTNSNVTRLVNQQVTNGQEVSEQGTYNLTMDTTGNSTPGRVNIQFIIDTTPPTVGYTPLTTVFETEKVNDRFVARKAVSLELKATDNLSGIASIQFRSKDTDWLSYTNDNRPRPIVFEKPGEYDIFFRATDGAGNTSAEQELKFVITLTTDGSVPGLGSPSAVPGQGTPTVGTNPDGTSPDAANGAATTPSGSPTVAALPGVLTAAPGQLTFTPTDETLTFKLVNAGGSPVVWNIQQLSGKAAEYLNFSLTGGEIAPAANVELTVRLVPNKFNVTNAKIDAPFNITYNTNTANLEIGVAILPQPAPSVRFISPVSGPLTVRNVPIKLDVIPTGLARPNHITIVGNYIEQNGGQPNDKVLPDKALEQRSWTINWDTTNLPPQPTMSLTANLCWSEDESNCLLSIANLGGLSIAKPSVTIVLTNPNPAPEKLGGQVSFTASQVTGIVDHVTYTYTYKDTGGAVFTKSERGAGTNFAFNWDTSVIPPQEGIKVDIKVCWGTEDTEESCTPPANQAQLPALYSVDVPVLTVAPLAEADQKNLPLQVKLSGTITKFNKGSIYVFVKANKGNSGGVTEEPYPVSPPAAGAQEWTITIPTNDWPSQEGITFTPKVCWDGKADGAFCYPSTPANLVAIIPPLDAKFADDVKTAVKDLASPVSLNLKVPPTPAGRVGYVKYLITYNASIGGTVTDFEFGRATAPDWKLTFDSVTAGLRPSLPGQPQLVTFKIQACNLKDVCAAISDTLPNLDVPASTITNPNPATSTALQTAINTATAAPIPVSGVVGGRSASNITLMVSYVSATGVPTIRAADITRFLPDTNVAKTVTFNWLIDDIPPQAGFSLFYRFCWGPGDLDKNLTNCYDAPPVYTGLSIPLPTVSAIYITRSTPYDLTKDFPIIISNTTSPKPLMGLPLEADVTGRNVAQVNWRVQVQTSGQPPKVLGNTRAGVDLIGSIRGSERLPIPIDTNQIPNDLTAADIKIIGIPVWKGNDNTEVLYPSTALTLSVKLVALNIDMNGGGVPAAKSITAGTARPGDKLMFNYQTPFNGTFSLNGTSIARVILNVNYDSAGLPKTLPTTLGNGNVNTAPQVGTGPVWNYTWDHLADTDVTPKPNLDDNISMNWRVCTSSVAADPSNSTCTPTDLTGSFTEVGGLKLVGIRFTDDQKSDNLDGLPPGKYFNSTFTATVELGNVTFDPNNTNFADTAVVRSVRFFAYATPTASNFLTVTIPESDAIILRVRNVITTTNNTLKVGVFWPDDVNTGYAALRTRLQANGNKISIAVQLCTQDPQNLSISPPNCGDWSGRSIDRMFTPAFGWSAFTQGLQAVIFTWRSYRDPAGPDVPCPGGFPPSSRPEIGPRCPAFYDFLQREVSTYDPVRIRLDVYPMDLNLIDVCTQPPLKPVKSSITVAYSAPGVLDPTKNRGTLITSPVTPPDVEPPRPAGPGGSCTFTYTWTPAEIGAIGFNPDIADTPGSVGTRGVELVASVRFLIPAPETNKASVFTHGSEKQPTISLATPAPTTTGTVLNFTTNLAANCTFNVVGAPALPGGVTIAPANPSGPGTAHTRTLSGFPPTQATVTYNYTMTCALDSNATINNTRTGTFDILADNTPPTISPVPLTANRVGTSATVNWTTSEIANCTINAGSISPAGPTFGALTGNGTTIHSQVVNNLTGPTAYTFTFICTDVAGNDSATITATITDSVAPIISPNPIVATRTGTTASAIWTTDENANCVVTPAAGGTLTGNGTLNHSQGFTGLVNNQSYVFSVTCTDGTGNASTAVNITIADNVPPVINPDPITATRTGTTATANWTTSENANCAITVPTPAGATVGAITGNGTTNHSQPLSTLAPGSAYTFSVTCTDPGGNVSTSVTVTVPDNVAPTIAPVSPITATRTGTTATANWTTSENANCAITAPTPAGATVGAITGNGTTNHSQPLSTLAPGSAYTFSVSCTDPAGNTSTSVTVSVPDNVAPIITVATVSRTNTTASVTFNSSESVNSCNATALTPGAPAALTTPSGIPGVTPVQNLVGLIPANAYTFSFTCTDPIGNISAATNVTIPGLSVTSNTRLAGVVTVIFATTQNASCTSTVPGPATIASPPGGVTSGTTGQTVTINSAVSTVLTINCTATASPPTTTFIFDVVTA